MARRKRFLVGYQVRGEGTAHARLLADDEACAVGGVLDALDGGAVLDWVHVRRAVRAGNDRVKGKRLAALPPAIEAAYWAAIDEAP